MLYRWFIWWDVIFQKLFKSYSLPMVYTPWCTCTEQTLFSHCRVWYFNFLCVPQFCPISIKVHYYLTLSSVLHPFGFEYMDLDLNLNYKNISTEWPITCKNALIKGKVSLFLECRLIFLTEKVTARERWCSLFFRCATR